MLAITLSFPPQRAQASMSIPNTRFRRWAQFIATWRGVAELEDAMKAAIKLDALAEQLDLTNRKWAAVDSFIYLCKLHGSINWIEEGGSLFPIREVPAVATAKGSRVMIYPTPMKQNASFGSPYSDLFREFQGRIVRDQSVLFVVGYSFGDEHVNNLIFQALVVPAAVL